MRDGNVEGLAAAHRQPGDGPVLAVGVNAIMLFHVRHNVSHEILPELIGWWLSACSLGCSWAKRAVSARMTRRHHYDHRFGFCGGNQVVQNESGAANRGPGLVAIPGPMKQIK